MSIGVGEGSVLGPLALLLTITCLAGVGLEVLRSEMWAYICHNRHMPIVAIMCNLEGGSLLRRADLWNLCSQMEKQMPVAK